MDSAHCIWKDGDNQLDFQNITLMEKEPGKFPF